MLGKREAKLSVQRVDEMSEKAGASANPDGGAADQDDMAESISGAATKRARGEQQDDASQMDAEINDSK